MKMSNKVYDILKYITQIIIPAVATLYFALASARDLKLKCHHSVFSTL